VTGPRPSCSLSIDLDGLEHYCRIYGLDPAAAGDQVYARGLPRLLQLCRETGLPATLFAIGADLQVPSRAAALGQAAAAGFEIANHSLSHRYDLTRLSRDAQEQELDLGAAAITAATGVAPVGFRAPGYTLSGTLLALLRARGYRYDASLLSSLPYYLVKAGALAALRVRGRRSASILGDPRVLLAPRAPFRPGAQPHRRALPAEPAELVEIPVSLLPGLGLPLIGGTLFLLGPLALPVLRRLLPGGLAHLHLELHGVDGLSLLEDSLPPGLGAQPDLRLPLATKLARLRAVFELFGRLGPCRTLREVAAEPRWS